MMIYDFILYIKITEYVFTRYFYTENGSRPVFCKTVAAGGSGFSIIKYLYLCIYKKKK